MGAVAIPYPVGNPNLPDKKEKDLRLDIVNKALKLIETDVEGQIIL